MRRFGRGVRRVPGAMNGWERKYASFLEERKMRGEIIDFWFEAVKLKLADKTHYSTDFLVQAADTTLEIHEVKGTMRVKKESGDIVSKPFVEDDAAVKIKVAAQKYPFRFIMAWLTREGWQFKEYE